MFAERETSGERPPPGFCSHNVLPLESLPLAEHFLNQIAMYSFMCTQLLQSFHAPLVRPQGHPSRPTLEFSALWSQNKKVFPQYLRHLSSRIGYSVFPPSLCSWRTQLL
ncbi:hypothetical protein AcV5_008007 [Taiwanofungus camphoratus]|nr:hypothetical protein AcV5_008007 [Antrodia cinnamomea]